MTPRLERDRSIRAPDGPVVLVVLDGVGLGRQDAGDAVYLARTPTLDWLDQVALRTSLLAHGPHVGMPTAGDMGNSEVGHNALGAGRVFAQGATLVAEAVSSGAIFGSTAWRDAVARGRAGGTLHLIGLLSDGNVHSHIDHVYALVRRAAADGVTRLRVHALQDGRDVGGTTALEYLRPLESVLSEAGAGLDYRVASGGGRMHVTMDRYEADWSIVERGWRAHVDGEGRGFASAEEAISTLRAENPGISDQVLPAWVVEAEGSPVGRIVDGDAVLFWNFRGDRAIELTRAFEEDDFSGFPIARRPDVFYAGMMQYDGDRGIPRRFLVEPPSIEDTVGELLAAAGVRQLAVSETQKFGHVTYFFNGNRAQPFSAELERYVEIESDRVVFSERPWMKAAEITDATLEHMRSFSPGLVRVNYPNGDMVGHTGDLEATIVAVEATDLCLGRLLRGVESMGGVAIVLADHGNADQMVQLDKKTGAVLIGDDGRPVPMTAHTLNPVPCWIWDPRGRQAWALDATLSPLRLSNVAATIVRLMGYKAPEMYDAPLVQVP